MDPDAVDALREAGAGAGDAGAAEGADADGRVPHGSSDDPDVLDFSANTNPETPEGVPRVYREALAGSRRYPPDGYPEFRAAAADYLGCAPGQVVPTPGGLAAIRLAIGTAVRPGESVLVPSPSFGEYAREVRLQGGDPAFVAHDDLLDADPAGYSMAVVCNPNNPTGEAADPDRLRAFADRCRAAGTTLLADEAFLDFTAEPSLAGREGVVVARSLTKVFGLPGLRAGFAVAAGRDRDRLATARLTWSLGWPAAAVGTHCLRADGFVAATRERVRRERDRLRERLGERFKVWPSDAPFLLLEPDEPVDEVLDRARRHGIELRDARTFRGLDAHLRAAVRTPGENDRLLDALL
ncbi:threonine-phosphate decarboxylase [Halobacteriales archaeon QS_1_68_17]|nr:MAG: threonine-phosphate decarboxylase [Halobacteriales archaeon QS_1_68_17]